MCCKNRAGLVHTLFAYSDLFRRVWALWEKNFSERDDNECAFRENSVPMQRLKRVLSENGIVWNGRCTALMAPFDRKHRGESDEARAAPFGRSEILHAPWIDGNVRRAVQVGAMMLLGVKSDDEKLMKAMRFVEVVVEGTIVFLHERALRADKPSLAELEREFTAKANTDVAYQFVTTIGFGGETTCAELTALQENASTRMRTDRGAELSLTAALNNLHRRVSHEPMAPIDIELGVCSLVRDAPNGASTSDYVWPTDFGVSAPCVQKRHVLPNGTIRTVLEVVVAEPVFSPPLVVADDETHESKRRRLDFEGKNEIPVVLEPAAPSAVEAAPLPPAIDTTAADEEAPTEDPWLQAFLQTEMTADDRLFDSLLSEMTAPTKNQPSLHDTLLLSPMPFAAASHDWLDAFDNDNDALDRAFDFATNTVFAPISIDHRPVTFAL